MGWTSCPLCERYSTKRFALGRGIAAHLYAVHTPWNPGKVERKKRRRLQEERQRTEELQVKRQRLKYQCEPQKHSLTNHDSANDDKPTTTNHQTRNCQDDDEQTAFTELTTWQPTPQEVEAWDAKVLDIVKDLEAKATVEQHSTTMTATTEMGCVGLDRNGEPFKPYRESLPLFLQAAADGDLAKLTLLITEARESKSVKLLLDTRDRHLSTAEHWAAGGGHIDCLKYLIQVRKNEHDRTDATIDNTGDKEVNPTSRKIRRRDGKTCLHYAARYGRLDCATYLLDVGYDAVDEVSGDGTTPLHMACYGLHVPVVKFLMQRGANVKATNEWGCSAAHWLAMAATKTSTSSSSTTTDKSPITNTTVSALQVYDLANLLKQHHVSFVEKQKQGHSAMHKAAQRQNRYLLEWLAECADEGGAGLTAEELKLGASKDDGGHTPSSIWRSVGGDSAFAKWMEEQGW